MGDDVKLPVICTSCGREMIGGNGRGRNVFCLDCRRTVCAESPEVLEGGYWENDGGIQRWRGYAHPNGGVTGALVGNA